MTGQEARAERVREGADLTPSQYMVASTQMYKDDVLNKKGTFFSKMPVGNLASQAAAEAVVEPSTGARLAGRL